jgi:hypothetical protein
MRFLSLFFGSLLPAFAAIHSDYFSAQEEARQKKKAIIVVFGESAAEYQSYFAARDTKFSNNFEIALVNPANSSPNIVKYLESLFVTKRGLVVLREQKGAFVHGNSSSIEWPRLSTAKLDVYFNIYGAYVSELGPERFRSELRKIPKLNINEFNDRIFASQNIWYDHVSMPPAYQDGTEVFTGVRPVSSDLSLGVSNFFDGVHFPFPLRQTAGIDGANSVSTINILSLPLDADRRPVPIFYSEETPAHRHYTRIVRWFYPAGTIFFEILTMRLSDGSTEVFEVRAARKEFDGKWTMEAFRPFDNAEELALQVEKLPVEFIDDGIRAQQAAAIRSESNLTPESFADQRGIVSFSGAKKVLPAFPIPVVRKLLARETFVAVGGSYFQKSSTGLTSYGPTGPSSSGDSIVPRGYRAGAIPVDSQNCRKCHEQTARFLADFDQQLDLYGNVWGSDQRFSFHIFEPSAVSDYGDYGKRSYAASTVLRGRFVSSGLVSPNPRRVDDQGREIYRRSDR